MRKIVHFNAAGALAAAFVLSAAGPAAADASACTHHFSGPQVCIRLEGNNFWNTPTAIWTNPPKNVNTRQVTLYVHGTPYAVGNPSTAMRVGKTLSHTWSRDQFDADAKLCVRFKGIDRTACEYVRDIGDRAPL